MKVSKACKPLEDSQHFFTISEMPGHKVTVTNFQNTAKDKGTV